MKRILPLAFVFLFCCSKQESTTTDAAQATVPQSTSSHGPVVLKLTPEEVKDVTWGIFQKFHDDLLMGDADLMAYIEELSVEGDHVTYMLVRHNGDDAGWRSDQEEEEDPPYAEDYEVIEEDEDVRVAREEAEEAAAEQARLDAEYTQRYGLLHPEEEQEPPKYYYTNELDTFTYDGTYVAVLEIGSPEATVKTVRIKFNGRLHQNNFSEQVPSEEPDDENIRVMPADFPVTDVLMEVGKPIQVFYNRLYLKAKVAHLTDADLIGLDKEDVGFLRNEIFARHGHTFKTGKMINHFNGKRWYFPRVDDAAPLLNKFEKRNVEFLKKKEG